MLYLQLFFEFVKVPSKSNTKILYFIDVTLL